METIRKRWKQVAAGAAAVGGLYLLYNRWQEHRQEQEDLAATSGYYVSRKTTNSNDEGQPEDLRPVPGSAQDKEPWLERTQLLVGTEALKKMAASHVLIVGLGGVGSYAAEFVVRAGVGKVTIMDGDDVDTTNRNRQLIALTSTEKMQKATVLEKRLRDINPDLEIHTLHKFLEIEDAEPLIESGGFDYVIDCIDSLQPKLHLMWASLKFKVPIISSMGAGGKMDPDKVFVGDISETEMDPLARFMRVRLKKQFGIPSGVGVVYSTERPAYNAIRATDGSNYKRSFYGTVSYTPALFGLKAAGVVIRELSGTKIIYTKRRRPLIYAGWTAARQVNKVYRGSFEDEDDVVAAVAVSPKKPLNSPEAATDKANTSESGERSSSKAKSKKENEKESNTKNKKKSKAENAAMVASSLKTPKIDQDAAHANVSNEPEPQSSENQPENAGMVASTFKTPKTDQREAAHANVSSEPEVRSSENQPENAGMVASSLKTPKTVQQDAAHANVSNEPEAQSSENQPKPSQPVETLNQDSKQEAVRLAVKAAIEEVETAAASAVVARDEKMS